MYKLSYELEDKDIDSFVSILQSSDFFYDFEVGIVISIFDETMEKGQRESEYFWVKLIQEGKIRGFAVFGPNPSTVGSWDLYWIAVSDEYRNKHFGSIILKDVELRAREDGCRVLWVETAGRPLYLPTRGFYESCDYEKVAQLKDYYDEGDDKVIYRKIL